MTWGSRRARAAGLELDSGSVREFRGNGALEVLRVMDWAAQAFDTSPPFSVGGASLGLWPHWRFMKMSLR